jgi:hypothetical protein
MGGAAAVAVVLFIATKHQGAAAASPAGSVKPRTAAESPPQPVVDRIVHALSTSDPAQMRAEATQLESEGWVLQADDLRKAADLIALTKGNPQVAGDALHAPRRPRPYSPLPGLMAPAVAPLELDQKRLQAQALIRDLEKHPRGKEDRALVRAFQEANGLRESGNYTPEVALTLAVAYGLVPPEPYWPTKGRKRAKDNYRAKLQAIADADPQRAEEFTEAAKGIK